MKTGYAPHPSPAKEQFPAAHLRYTIINSLGATVLMFLVTLPNVFAQQPAAATNERERLMLERIERLERRLAELETVGEARDNKATDEAVRPAAPAPAAYVADDRAMSKDAQTSSSAVATRGQDAAQPSAEVKPQTSIAASEDRSVLDFFRRTSVNLTVDGYYGYNFNTPTGGVNLLRAYDVTSNSFSLNQAAIVVERLPDVEAGERFGLRLDLQYGQATETVQGNLANEPRPQVFRNVWQAYGTYVAPVGKGLTLDFGKWAGALGYETNYTKDNFNYSRSYFFNFLPFYHTGFRAAYPVNDKLTVTGWLVNGANQTEDFNGFKSAAALVTYKPTARVTTQFNYYNGQEQRDRNLSPNPTFAPFPSQPGLSTDVIRPVPGGRFHVLDAYATVNATDKLTLAIEGDYVVNRVFRDSPAQVVFGGAAYARYQLTPKAALAGRFEYLGDRGGLFSGVAQALKEGTLTAEYKFADGFLGRAEYRRDYSNREFFFTEQPGVLKREQNTATLGLVWWIGRKQGAW